MAVRFSILTLFPEYFDSPLSTSLLGRAQKNGFLQIDRLGLREFGEGRYRAVDDKPYGGGAGMIMMPTVLEKALGHFLGGEEALKTLEAQVASFRAHSVPCHSGPHVVFLSPQGAHLTAKKARQLASYPHLVLICGHYEGLDERAVEAFVHEEVSIGDYVLTGGEAAAVVLLEAVSRFVPGVVGEQTSVDSDTFEDAPDNAPGGLKAPAYTRPAVWRGRAIPDILTSGHHAQVSRWRRLQSESRTAQRRPDLIQKK